MDNYMELAKQYIARKESKKRNVFEELFKADYNDIDAKWEDKKGASPISNYVFRYIEKIIENKKEEK